MSTLWQNGTLIAGIFAGIWAGAFPNTNDPSLGDNHIVSFGWNADGVAGEPRVRMGVESGFATADGRHLSEWMWEYDNGAASRRPISAWVDRDTHESNVAIQGETRIIENDGALSWLFASGGRAIFGGYILHTTTDSAILYGMSAGGSVEIVRVLSDGTILLGGGGSTVRVNGDLLVDGDLYVSGSWQ